MDAPHSDLDLADEVDEVDAATGMRLVAAGAVLLDVREVPEWDAGHAPEAVLVPMGELARVPDVVGGPDAVSAVVVICRSGNRSRTVTAVLRNAGYRAVNLAGGMGSWVQAGGAAVDRSGAPGVVA